MVEYGLNIVIILGFLLWEVIHFFVQNYDIQLRDHPSGRLVHMFM